MQRLKIWSKKKHGYFTLSSWRMLILATQIHLLETFGNKSILPARHKRFPWWLLAAPVWVDFQSTNRWQATFWLSLGPAIALRLKQAAENETPARWGLTPSSALYKQAFKLQRDPTSKGGGNYSLPERRQNDDTFGLEFLIHRDETFTKADLLSPFQLIRDETLI